MSCRNMCKECPYKVKSENNKKLLEFVNKDKQNRSHKCHMIDAKIWNNVTNENVCVGWKSEI